VGHRRTPLYEEVSPYSIRDYGATINRRCLTLSRDSNERLEQRAALGGIVVILRALFTAGALVGLAGCANTNFATSPTPASVQEEFFRKEMTVWGGTRVFSIGNLEFGKLNNENNSTFVVNPGPTTIKVWYYANRGNNPQLLFWQTDTVSLDVDLKPNGRYQVKGTYGEDEVTFRLVDLGTGLAVSETVSAKVVRRPSPVRAGPVYIPIFVPSR
jgi:hypothetical protein